MIHERRVDQLTADAVKEALHLQREVGFKIAFENLKNAGVCSFLAAALLYSRNDRRLGQRPNLTDL